MFTLYLPNSVTNMEVLHDRSHNIKAVVVALDNGEIRVYVEQDLVSRTRTNKVPPFLISNSR